MARVIWTEYLLHRVRLRGFDRAAIEQIVLFTDERYFDSVTQRMVGVGRDGQRLVVIPYEQQGDTMTPVTVHATTRQQVNFRVRTGRFKP